MEKDEYREIAYTMIRYIAFALKLRPLPSAVLTNEELKAVYRVASRHQLVTLTASGLKSAGICSEEFKSAAAKARWQSLLFDAEFSEISKKLESANIPYLPLKGILLKKLYPGIGAREMSDIDVLIGREDAEAVREIMLASGYECRMYDKSNHDVYFKKPVFTFEMHRLLFSEDSQLYDGYFSEKNYFIGNHTGLCYEMTPEDMYIYLMAHAYLHYSSAGTGIRPLIDFYLYLEQYESSMNFAYIDAELAKLGLTDFESVVKNLSRKMWSPNNLNEQERAGLDYFIFSGVYGNKKQLVHNLVNQAVGGENGISKTAYLRNRFTASKRQLRNDPFYAKHPKLAPVKRFGLLLKAVVTKPKAIIYELNELKNAGKKK